MKLIKLIMIQKYKKSELYKFRLKLCKIINPDFIYK